MTLLPHENFLNYKDSTDGRKGHRNDFKGQRWGLNSSPASTEWHCDPEQMTFALSASAH